MKARKKLDLEAINNEHHVADTAIFEALCQIARECNTAKFHTMYYEYEQKNQRKLSFNFIINEQAAMHDRNTVIRQMALEGNHEAVNFLIQEFGIKANKAVEGYARAGNVEKVNQFILTDNYRSEAALGYALAGNVEQVDIQLHCGANINMAAYGYGRAGNLDAAKKLFDSHKSSDNSWKIGVFGVEGFAHSKLYKQTQDFILHAAGGVPAEKNDVKKFFAKVSKKQDDFSLYCNSAMGGFACTNTLFNDEALLELLACTDNDAVRHHYMTTINEDRTHRNLFDRCHDKSFDDIVKQADSIRRTMHEQSLGFAAARKFMDDKATETARQEAETAAAEKAKLEAEAAAAEKAKLEAEAATAEKAKQEVPAMQPEPAAVAPVVNADAKKEETARHRFYDLFCRHKHTEATNAAIAPEDKGPALK